MLTSLSGARNDSANAPSNLREVRQRTGKSYASQPSY